MNFRHFSEQFYFLNDIIELDMANLQTITIVYHSFEIFSKLNGNFENTNNLNYLSTLNPTYLHCSSIKALYKTFRPSLI